MKISHITSLISLFGFAVAMPSVLMAAEAKAPVDGIASITRVAQKSEPVDEIVSMPSFGTVNPMTGRSTKYEEMGKTLQEKTLEAKIAEQEFAIAKSRAEALKLRTDRPQGDSPVAARLPEDVRAQAQKVAAKKAVPTKRSASADSKREQPAPSVAAYRAPERPRYVGVLSAGGELVAMVSYNGRISSIKEGGADNGMSVSSITKSNAVINGVTVPFEKGVSMINLPETRQPVVPGATMGQVANPSSRGVIVQGVNTAAVQPVAPGSPLPVATTQPTRFPTDLYNR